MNNEFALQCLKFAYDTIGYENLMKELLFMKYNDHGVINVSDPEPEKTEKADEDESNEEESENEESCENIYCEKVFKNGRRCMIKTVDNSKYCNRHK